jgi:hypothetical protein
MFQLKLNDIELVSKPEYYLKYIIAIIGDTRMLLKVARQLSPSGKISIGSPTGHGPMTGTHPHGLSHEVRPQFFLPSA